MSDDADGIRLLTPHERQLISDIIVSYRRGGNSNVISWKDEISKITSELTENFSSKIKLNYKHDESLIGGLIVQVGSTMVDTSIKNKLQQIENRMVEA